MHINIERETSYPRNNKGVREKKTWLNISAEMGEPLKPTLRSPNEEPCMDTLDIMVDREIDIMDELERAWDIGYDEHEWDFMAWRQSQCKVSQDGNDEMNTHRSFNDEFTVKGGNAGIWEAKSTFSLNLNLNYQEVIDAWSERGPLWVEGRSISSAANASLVGGVPTMEERERRRARVLKYKEKRQSRLFSKKIRYEARKLSAEKRPRLKGRFVKRSTEEMEIP